MTYTSESESCEGGEPCLPEVGFPSSGLENLKKQPNGDLKKPHSCDFNGCTAKFSRPWRLTAHRAVHLGKKPFPCDYTGCNKAYTSNYHLRRHRLTAHTPLGKQKNFRCHYPGCEQEFKSTQNVKKHFKRTHEEKTCKECGQRGFNHLQLKKHYKAHTAGVHFECNQCGMKFEHKFWFNRHLRSHALHVCPIKGCFEAHQNWSNLRKHISTHPFDFICDYCKKGYRRRTFLKAHILRHLKGVKRKQYELKTYNCDQCFIKLLGKASLRRHIQVVHESVKKESVSSTSVPKVRAPRKDKGIPKRSLAVLLSEVVVPKEVEHALITSASNIVYLTDI